VTLEPFKLYHIELMKAQGVQSAQQREVSHVPSRWANVGTALTAREGERIIACGGVVHIHPGMGLLWAVLSEAAGTHMTWLHRATIRFLEINPPRRLEATVEKGFIQGCRWLTLLGFEFEGEMAAYGIDGETHLRYGRVRP